MKPSRNAGAEYLRAFAEVLSGLQESLRGAGRKALPVRVYIAGGAALHLLTGARISEDIDASFSRRVLVPEVQVSYRDADGRARVLYFDRNYNDTLGLLHPDAYPDSHPLEIAGIDRAVLDARVLAPVDLAVTKLARFSEQDRTDVEVLARHRLISAAALRKRAEEALQGYIGEMAPVRTSIEVACRVVEAARPAKKS